MTLEEFLKDFNYAPYSVIEVAEIAEDITDDQALSSKAKAHDKAESEFKAELERVGFEFG